MAEDRSGRRRRRRVRSTSSPEPSPEGEVRGAPPATSGAARDLAGAGRSQLGVMRALRARDVNRPSDADIAAAEQDTPIIRLDRHTSRRRPS